MVKECLGPCYGGLCVPCSSTVSLLLSCSFCKFVCCLNSWFLMKLKPGRLSQMTKCAASLTVSFISTVTCTFTGAAHVPDQVKTLLNVIARTSSGKLCLHKVHSGTWATCPWGVNSKWANQSNKNCGYVTGRETAQLNRAVRMSGGGRDLNGLQQVKMLFLLGCDGQNSAGSEDAVFKCFC